MSENAVARTICSNITHFCNAFGTRVTDFADLPIRHHWTQGLQHRQHMLEPQGVDTVSGLVHRTTKNPWRNRSGEPQDWPITLTLFHLEFVKAKDQKNLGKPWANSSCWLMERATSTPRPEIFWAVLHMIVVGIC